MKFYIRKSDLVRVYRGCDLGDSVSVPVYMYPHREQAMEMLTCETQVIFMPDEESQNVPQPCPECSTDKLDVIHTDLSCSEAQDDKQGDKR